VWRPENLLDHDGPLLLDTHIWIRYLEGDTARITEALRTLLDDVARGAGLQVLDISCWELGVKTTKGALTLSVDAAVWLRRAVAPLPPPEKHGPVTGGLRFTTLSAAYQFTCGVTTAQALVCWGYNEVGQLGAGDAADRHVPTTLGAGRAWRTERRHPPQLRADRRWRRVLLGRERLRPGRRPHPHRAAAADTRADLPVVNHPQFDAGLTPARHRAASTAAPRIRMTLMTLMADTVHLAGIDRSRSALLPDDGPTAARCGLHYRLAPRRIDTIWCTCFEEELARRAAAGELRYRHTLVRPHSRSRYGSGRRGIWSRLRRLKRKLLPRPFAVQTVCTPEPACVRAARAELESVIDAANRRVPGALHAEWERQDKLRRDFATALRFADEARTRNRRADMVPAHAPAQSALP
jgi:hypothetical protein